MKKAQLTRALNKIISYEHTYQGVAFGKRIAAGYGDWYMLAGKGVRGLVTDSETRHAQLSLG